MTGKVLAIDLDLDEPGDAGPAQARYLGDILAEHRDQEGSAFAIRFQYHLDGTSHWHGDMFVLEVEGGQCLLRYANSDDTSEHVRQRELRFAKRWLVPGKPLATPDLRRFAVELEAPWIELGGEDLREALELFRVAAVMNS